MFRKSIIRKIEYFFVNKMNVRARFSQINYEIVNDEPEFFALSIFHLRDSLQPFDNSRMPSSNYFIVPCENVKKLGMISRMCSFEIVKKHRVIINKCAKIIIGKYNLDNGHGIYRQRAILARGLLSISLDNICAIKLEIDVKISGNSKTMNYVITQFYRKLSLEYFILAKEIDLFEKNPLILAPFIEVCAQFAVPTEIICEIAKYVPIIRKEKCNYYIDCDGLDLTCDY